MNSEGVTEEGQKLLLDTILHPADAESHYGLALAYIEGRFGLPKSDSDAINCLERSTETGHPLAPGALADMYYTGRCGLRKNYLEAARLYRMSANHGDKESQFMLGYLHEKGRGVEKDLHAAARLYWLASTQECERAETKLGRLEEKGAKFHKDWTAAFQYCKMAADRNVEISPRLQLYKLHERAILQMYSEVFLYCRALTFKGMVNDLLQYCEFKDDDETFFIESFRYTKWASELGDPGAQMRLCWIYENGRGVSKDLLEAFNYCRMAAENNFAEACFKLATTFYFDGNGVTRDGAEAVKYLESASELGHPKAQFMLADIYFEGYHVTQDEEKSIELYKSAANQGHIKAQILLGKMYEGGTRVKKNLRKAEKYYSMAAEQGDEQAQYNLASICAKKNEPYRAAEYYEKASQRGHILAQIKLGDMYAKGIGIERDALKAAQLYGLASARGHAMAQIKLGDLFLNGDGLPIDFVKAEELYQSAAEQGFTEARERLEALDME